MNRTGFKAILQEKDAWTNGPHDRGLRGTRRGFLGSALAVSAAALLPAVKAFGQPPAEKLRLVDVHHHFAPDPFVKYTSKHGKPLITYRKEHDSAWSLSRDLEDMDQTGNVTAMLTASMPGFLFGTLEESRAVIRECNEAAARIEQDHRGRFGNLASIPLQDTEGSLRELEYALDTLKADGVGVFSSYHSRWLGDASYAPVYEELNRRGTVVYVHPTASDCCARLVPGVNDNIVEFGADTTRTIASLLYSGTTRKYPNIRWIFSHGGGMLTAVIERFLLGSGKVEIVPGIPTEGQYGEPSSNLPEGALPEIRKLYFDTAQVGNPVTMDALRKIVPVSQILFGTDYWYRGVKESADNLLAARVFNQEELQQVLHGNAERLFSRLVTA